MLLQLIKFFALVALFASVVLVMQTTIASAMTARQRRAVVNQRLKLMQKGMTRDAVGNLLRPDRRLNGSGYPKFVTSFYRTVGQAMLSVSPGRVLIGMAIATSVIFGLLLLFAISSGARITVGTFVLLPAVSLAIGFGLPWMVISRRAQKRAKMMEQQFPVAIDIFTRSLRAGHPVSSAISLLTQEMVDPIGSEFGIVADEVAYGLDLNESLANLASRWDLEDLRMFAVCISVQSETGGNLAEILSNLGTVIRDRASLFLKVRALSSEGRVSAWMLSVLPVLTFVMLFLTNPPFYLDVATDPIFTATFTALMVLYLLGVLWIRNMVKLKV